MPKISSLNDIPVIARYLARIGAEPRALVEAVVKEHHGKYYTDVVRIRIHPLTGEVTTWDRKTRKSSPEHEPTAEEAKAIKETIRDYEFPRPKRTAHYELPKHLVGATIFPFKARNGELIMIVQRIDARAGEKTYLPWTLFDDDEWRQCEPEGKLPLYGLEYLKPGIETVFIHEGPKKAAHCRKLFFEAHTDEEIAERDAHPWKNWMMQGVHIGYHGGALSPYRTDWDALLSTDVKNVYIIPDNDAPGINAVPQVAEHLRGMNVYSITWGKLFGASFDMAEPWPKVFFEKIGDTTFYVGPTFDDLLRPATWATDKFDPTGKGNKKPIVVLRKEFANQWRYIAEADVYINIRFPFICYPQVIFDKLVRPFSDTDATSKLVNAAHGAQSFRLVYRPDREAREFAAPNAPIAVNTHVPSRVVSVDGDDKPFQDLLAYMFVNPRERHQVRRYLATLIAHPEIRMSFAQLWVSEVQGIGKNTLGEHILAPLVGFHNCSFPGEQLIVESQFNSWLVRKRLVFVGEIYSGHSWKAYNKLKSFITDKTVTVNEKYMREYPIDNWAHIIACSNSEKALKIEKMDRRWYCPELATIPWKRDQFEALYAWIRRGGLQIVKHWAETFGDYILPGENAEMTDRKREMIEESLSDEERALTGWCNAFREDKSTVEMVVSDRIIKQYLTVDQNLQVKFTSPLDMRRVMKAYGWLDPGFQINIDGVSQRIMMSPACAILWREQTPYDELDRDNQQTRRDWLRKRLRSMSDPEGKGQEFMNRAKQMGV